MHGRFSGRELIPSQIPNEREECSVHAIKKLIYSKHPLVRSSFIKAWPHYLTHKS